MGRQHWYHSRSQARLSPRSELCSNNARRDEHPKRGSNRSAYIWLTLYHRHEQNIDEPDGEHSAC